MIGRRRASKYTQNVESLQQSSFTSLRGIDCSKAPTNNDTVLNVKNLDVDYDGGLILRKPLLHNISHGYDNIHYTYNGQVMNLTVANTGAGKGVLINVDGVAINTIKVIDIFGNAKTLALEGNTTLSVGIDFLDCKFINTSSTTLIYNAKVNLKTLANKTGVPLYNSRIESEVQYRMFKWSSKEYTVLEMVTPEMNVVTPNDIAIDFNMTLDNPLAIRDNYTSEVTAIRGLIGYTDGIRFDTPVEFNEDLSVKSTHLDKVTVEQIIESKSFKMLPSEIVDGSGIYLKAFFDKPNIYNGEDDSNLRILWESSNDGISWRNLTHVLWSDLDTIAVPELLTNDVTDTSSLAWSTLQCYKFKMSQNLTEDVNNRYAQESSDVLIIPKGTKPIAYKCTLLKVKKSEDSPYFNDPKFPTVNNDETTRLNFIKDYELDSKVFYMPNSSTETLTQDFKNPITGNMIYYNHALYSISPDFKNNIYVSNPDSAIFPVSRIIDLGTYQGTTISKLIPWRDYLVAFTENSVHLITEQEVGFTTKTVNTFIGVPERDANTCVSILNGIIFKSGNKLYTLIPNYNSGDESILNISDISKPIEHILENLTYNEEYKPFAFTTSESYYLFVPDAVDTKCLKYNYSRKIWTFYTYPRVFYDYKIMSVDDIRLFAKADGVIYEYYFEKEPSDIIDLQMYGDYIDLEKDDDNAYKVVPIEFFVDSGQKTDNIVLTKQFVESKIIVATLSDKDNFQMDVNIAVEGNTFKKHIDLNTDGALLRNDPNQLLTLGSSADSADSDTFNTIRQMFIRYSGKGKTIRHIISGTSLYKFKIYETLYRYKILNVKQ